MYNSDHDEINDVGEGDGEGGEVGGAGGEGRDTATGIRTVSGDDDPSSDQCTMCTCGTKLSAGLNKLGHILNSLFYYPIEHIFVPCCSVRRNMGKFQFS